MKPGFFEREFTFDRVSRILFFAIGVAILCGFAWYIKDALIPFFLGWILASILMPVVRFFQHKLHFKSRLLSIMATFLSIIALFFALSWLTAPSISEEISKAGDLIQKVENVFIEGKFLKDLERSFGIESIDGQEMSNFLKTYVPKSFAIAGNAINHLFSIFSIVFILLYSFFIMLYFENFKDGFYAMLPKKTRTPVRKIVDDVVNSTSRYFKGQSMIASLVGVLFSIGFLIIGMPMAIPLGLFIGLLNMVPYAQFIGLIPTIILCAIKSSETGTSFWSLLALCLLVFCVVQITQDMVLTPKIMGHVTGLNPAIILLCLSIGGTLFGFWGFIMALPLAPMIVTYYRKYVLHENIDEPEDVGNTTDVNKQKSNKRHKHQHTNNQNKSK